MKRGALRTLLLLTCLFLLLIISGCTGDRSPTAIVQPRDGSSSGIQLLGQPTSTALLTGPLGGAATSVTSTIRANRGGDLSIGLLRVKFPPRSIAEDTDVTLLLVDQERMLFRLEPTDLTLKRPLWIMVEPSERTDYCNQKALRVVRLVDGMPEILPTLRDAGRYIAEAGSLGDYGIAEMETDGSSLRFIRYLSGPGYRTKLIKAGHGGVVQYDRYRVSIPRDALAEDTYITVRDPGTGYLMCELEPHGIAFQRPVDLELDLHGLDYQPYDDWTVFWYDETTGLWEDLGASFVRARLTTQLGHFSRYAAGRAGW